eukprot:CAMPEP_0184487750 /NCGR_PEP_ID=MMETSP0113_2-20130426/10312_1 /TAXON_ID=91329 /ORGANISM="Norrisiella sphaerica, Strain BC52" /LENGTH=146 /DNA_ID=CAMNT_0026870147 /DNA_START=351 /DNA_END=791 /DNA_ORIENTATION=-
MKQLEMHYKRMQQKYHPDQYATKPQSEQAIAAAESSSINAAYDVLKDPLRRARYLLDTSNEDEEGTVTDPELLMKVMEYQERIDGSSNQKELTEIRDEIESRYEKAIQDISEAFSAGNPEDAREKINCLSYFKTLSQRISEKLHVE